jgi:hypothetical protein
MGRSVDTRLKECQRHIWRSQPWRSTASTWGTTSSYRTPPSSPPNPDKWLASSGRQLRLSSIPTI